MTRIGGPASSSRTCSGVEASITPSSSQARRHPGERPACRAARARARWAGPARSAPPPPGAPRRIERSGVLQRARHQRERLVRASACGRAAGPPPWPGWRRRRGGTRRRPSPRRCVLRGGPWRRRAARPPPRAAGTHRTREGDPRARTPRTPWARRGSGGFAGSSYSARQAAQRVNSRHRRPRAVVGEIADDGEARPAVGAVDERIAVPAIRRILHLPEARFAGGDVGRDDGAAGRATRAVDDDELAVPARLERAHLEPVDAGEWRQIAPEHLDEAVYRGRIAFHLDPHAVRVVPHQPGETEPARHPVHGGPEPHALHRAGDPDSGPCERLGDGSTGHGSRRVRARRPRRQARHATHRRGLSAGGQRRLCHTALICRRFSLSSVRHALEAYVHCARASPYRERPQHLRPDVRGRRRLTVPA